MAKGMKLGKVTEAFDVKYKLNPEQSWKYSASYSNRASADAKVRDVLRYNPRSVIKIRRIKMFRIIQEEIDVNIS